MRERRLEFASAVIHADTMKAYKDLICTACDFYKPGDELECSAYKALAFLIDSGRITEEEVRFAISQACRQSSSEEVWR